MLQFTPYGVRLYRNTEDVRRDILDVRAAIAEVRQKLDIRDLIVASLMETEHARDAIPLLRRAIEDAHEALHRLRELQEELTMLQEELGALM